MYMTNVFCFKWNKNKYENCIILFNLVGSLRVFRKYFLTANLSKPRRQRKRHQKKIGLLSYARAF